jgi:hypothetical protein
MHAVHLSSAKREAISGSVQNQNVAAATESMPDAADAAPKQPVAFQFKNQRIGSMSLQFTDSNGHAFKPKKSDGYVALKVRNMAGTQFGYFVIHSDDALPTKRAMVMAIEQYYARLKDARVQQVHLQVQTR